MRVQRITREDALVHSVICLDGRAQALPVSAAYEGFVRSPTGVIERLTGHGAYRMDVDGQVDEGSSWQLAAVLAHAVEHDTESHKTQALFATGEVDHDLAVRPVLHVAHKLARLADVLPDVIAHLKIDPSQARILVPVETPDLPDDVCDVPVLPVADIEGALQLAGLTFLDQAVEQPPRSMAPAPRRRGLLKPGLAVIAAAALMFWLGIDVARWAALSGDGQVLALEQELNDAEDGRLSALQASAYRQWLSLQKPADDAVRTEGALLLADTPGDCVDAAKTRSVALTKTFDGPETVCTIEMRGFTPDVAQVLVGRMAYWPSGLGAGRAGRIMRGSADSTGRIWTLDFKDHPMPGAMVRLVAILGAAEVTGAQPWYRDLLSAPIDSVAFNAAEDRLARLGYSVVAQDWQRN